MAAPSLTYTLTNGSTADASQVMENLNNLLNGITDGTKDLSISALTAAGTATLNGHVNLGNSSADLLTVTASLASNLVPNATGTLSLGSSALGYLDLYLAASGDADTARIVAAAHSADRVYTIPDVGADASFVMTALAQTISATKTFTAAQIFSSTANSVSGNTSFDTTATNTVAFSSLNQGLYLFLVGRVSTATNYGVALVSKGQDNTGAVVSLGTSSTTITATSTHVQCARASGGSVSHNWALLQIVAF